MERTLVDDGLILMPAGDIDGVLKRVAEFIPALAIVDDGLLQTDPAFIRNLRQKTGNPDLPVIVLTTSPDIADAKSRL